MMRREHAACSKRSAFGVRACQGTQHAALNQYFDIKRTSIDLKLRCKQIVQIDVQTCIPRSEQCEAWRDCWGEV